MKSVYYGEKHQLVAGLHYYPNYYSSRWKTSEQLSLMIEGIKKEKEEDTARYTHKKLIPHSKEIFLMEKDVSYVSKIGDKIEIRGKEGVITDRRHDLDTDTMYYYTDITALIDESDYEQGRIRMLNSLMRETERELERALRLEEYEKQEQLYERMLNKEKLKAEEEQSETFIGKIINWFKG